MDEVKPPSAEKELTPAEIDQLEWLIGTIDAKNLIGETLSESEKAIYDALNELRSAERASREAFAAFYLSAPNGDGSSALPDTVTQPINRWIQARRNWDEQVERFFRRVSLPSLPVRTGQRVRANLPDSLRIPASAPARDLMSLFFAPHLWRTQVTGDAVMATRQDASVRVDSDELAGLSAEATLKQIARQGASVAQTFFALIGLWQERNMGKPYETYLTIYASDLLRYQGRRQTRNGGYHKEDILAKGREIYLLSRISVPLAATHTATNADGGTRDIRLTSLGRLLSLESLEIAETTDRDKEGTITQSSSVVRFQYHLGKTVQNWVGDDHANHAQISGKLLTYHPVRQKYQILLGFSIACYDRLHRDDDGRLRRISLPDLLNLASLEIPQKRLSEFLATIEDALNELGRDGVVPDLHLQKPERWHEMLARRDARSVIAGSSVTFSALSSERFEKRISAQNVK
ncbi:MAG: hypothetical protein WCP07_02010 [bacterium]|jgi:hypothetical protein